MVSVARTCACSDASSSFANEILREYVPRLSIICACRSSADAMHPMIPSLNAKITWCRICRSVPVARHTSESITRFVLHELAAFTISRNDRCSRGVFSSSHAFSTIRYGSFFVNSSPLLMFCSTFVMSSRFRRTRGVTCLPGGSSPARSGVMIAGLMYRSIRNPPMSASAFMSWQ